jgi:peptide/nickel transport system permease protein
MAKKPLVSALVLGGIVLLCALADLLAPGDAARMDVSALLLPPGPAHPFGTDTLGRDLFAMVLHGGRASLLIGLLASGITAALALLYGAAAGLAPRRLDDLLMRASELLMSIPPVLYCVTVLAVLGQPGVLPLSVVIGATSWMGLAKLVRAEVRRESRSEYIAAARLMGAGFGYILRRHVLPNVLPGLLYMLIYNVGTAIAAEATLSFLGLGMPPGSATWGVLMSLSQDALLTNSWWLLLIPSLFLVATLVCMTNLGEYVRRSVL